MGDILIKGLCLKFLVVSIFLMGCVSQTENLTSLNNMLQGKWVLQSLNGQTINTDEFQREVPYLELMPDLSKVQGYTGCNRLNGEFQVLGDEIIFRNIVTTRMKCIGPPIEEAFLLILNSPNLKFKFEDEILVLLGDDKSSMFLKKEN
jgi:heat shock protein HslJ